VISLESLRLLLIAISITLLQVTFYTRFPEWRAGVDLYVIFLLLLTAARGPVYGGILALIGGAVMDCFSIQLPAFHVLYYLLPVAAASFVRARMLIEYRQLGTLFVGGLLLFKILAQFAVARASGWVDSAYYLFHLNYLSLLLELALTWLFWPSLAKLVPAVMEVRRSA